MRAVKGSCRRYLSVSSIRVPRKALWESVTLLPKTCTCRTPHVHGNNAVLVGATTTFRLLSPKTRRVFNSEIPAGSDPEILSYLLEKSDWSQIPYTRMYRPAPGVPASILTDGNEVKSVM